MTRTAITPRFATRTFRMGFPSLMRRLAGGAADPWRVGSIVVPPLAVKAECRHVRRMQPERSQQPGPRLATLLRHLTDSAEREAVACERFATAIERLLEVRIDRERGLAPLLAAVTSALPAFDSAGVAARTGEGWEVRAAIALTPALGPLAPATLEEGLLAEALRTRQPVLAWAGGPTPLGAPLPEGTRAAYAIP